MKAPLEDWTFETKWPGTESWSLSKGSYPSPDTAGRAAGEWLSINGENGCFIEVRLVIANRHIPPDESR